MSIPEFFGWWAAHPDTPTGTVSVQVTPTTYLVILGALVLGVLYFARAGATKKDQPVLMEVTERGSAWLLAIVFLLGLIVILAAH